MRGVVERESTSMRMRHGVVSEGNATVRCGTFDAVHLTMEPIEQGRRVLVADDDDDLRDLIAATLRHDGYDVVEAHDGDDLIRRLDVAINSESEMPDLLITDVRMPGLSGLGVLSALRRARVAMPVIVITVFADDSIRTVATRLGAVAVLQKPFEMDDLRREVSNARAAFESASARFRM